MAPPFTEKVFSVSSDFLLDNWFRSVVYIVYVAVWLLEIDRLGL
jgi:hypothetical protein